jgi:hypothetical protein
MAQSKADEPNPRETQQVLRYLLAASNSTVQPGSHCSGNFGQKEPAKILDILSMHLAYFGEGQNRIVGHTKITGDTQHCELRITRSNGEDISNCTLRFTVKNELLVLNSLQCTMTP